MENDFKKRYEKESTKNDKDQMNDVDSQKKQDF